MDDVMRTFAPVPGMDRSAPAPMPAMPAMPSMPNVTLAMAYVPFQKWEQPFDAVTALDRGTLFPSLDKPFLAGGDR